MDFNYKPFEEDVLIMGRGGSGKTYLAEHLILRNLKVPFWLWNHTWTTGAYRNLEGYHTHELTDLPYGRAIYEPMDKSVSSFDKFAQKASGWSNLVFVVEEAHSFAGKHKIKSSNFAQIVNAGRPRGISWICITRRPQQLNNDILADADHIFCFDLELPNDTLYVEKWIGEKVELFLEPERRKALSHLPKLGAHYFVYKDVNRGIVEVGKI